jgi:hypothetical protein
MMLILLLLTHSTPGEQAKGLDAPAELHDGVGGSMGWVEMDRSGQLRVTYDSDHVTILVRPGDQQYAAFLEMAGEIRPCERKRLVALAATYDANPGEYVIYGMSKSENAVSEPAKRRITSRSGTYECYDKFLSSKGRGYHYMTSTEAQSIYRCISSLPK